MTGRPLDLESRNAAPSGTGNNGKRRFSRSAFTGSENEPLAEELAIGTPAELRVFLFEAAERAQVHADLIATYAAIGDDVGAAYAGRKLIAYTKAIAATIRDLHEAAQREQPDALQ